MFFIPKIDFFELYGCYMGFLDDIFKSSL